MSDKKKKNKKKNACKQRPHGLAHHQGALGLCCPPHQSSLGRKRQRCSPAHPRCQASGLQQPIHQPLLHRSGLPAPHLPRLLLCPYSLQLPAKHAHVKNCYTEMYGNQATSSSCSLSAWESSILNLIVSNCSKKSRNKYKTTCTLT